MAYGAATSCLGFISRRFPFLCLVDSNEICLGLPLMLLLASLMILAVNHRFISIGNVDMESGFLICDCCACESNTCVNILAILSHIIWLLCRYSFIFAERHRYRLSQSQTLIRIIDEMFATVPSIAILMLTYIHARL